MGELPFALAPEAALGAWLREAEREMEPHRTAGTYRGFDGTELADMISLTTIEQPSRDIGRKAVDLLLNKIDNPDAPTERVMMDWRFISRAST